VPKRSGGIPSASFGEGEEDFSPILQAISRDLKTSLTVIAGSLSTLLKEEDVALDEAERRELLETAYAGVERLTRVVDDLLRMAKLEAHMVELRLEPYAIEEVIGAAIAELGPLLDGRRCEVHLPPEFPLVSFDFALMVHALVNVLENAIQYSPTEALIEVWASQGPGYCLLRVGDRGSGIPAEDQERVFEKFRRLTPGAAATPGGVGLGLAIAKGIVAAHGGRIWAEGREGGGTIVSVSLPLAVRR